MTDKQLLEKYPYIEWKEPIKMMLGEKEGLACRICIAQKGIKGTDTDRLMTMAEFVTHIHYEHEGI